MLNLLKKWRRFTLTILYELIASVIIDLQLHINDIIVLHYTAMPSAQSALTRLCLAEAEVSAHYLIGRCGTVWQLVQEDQRAWHAGVGAWGDVRDVNSRSIGIEIDNDGYSPFSHMAMVALEGLLPGILQRWAIPPERVIGHQDMAPGRKSDPGRRFDWRGRLSTLHLRSRYRNPSNWLPGCR